ncbi:unnamed protein product [Linum trigynum]|uniref:Uncharacterized protein n=1 Tax=Linum trigynum TaxID=586398 RepID=A0AAV2GQU7_9ROSI
MRFFSRSKLRLREPLDGKIPKSTYCNPTQLGRVHQVVEAFETGLVIAREEDGGGKGVNSRLNEYGSNMLDHIMENRKRVLDELEGEVGNPPTPKKQFVESVDDLEKVEEASLEWPQADK